MILKSYIVKVELTGANRNDWVPMQAYAGNWRWWYFRSHTASVHHAADRRKPRVTRQLLQLLYVTRSGKYYNDESEKTSRWVIRFNKEIYKWKECKTSNDLQKQIKIRSNRCREESLRRSCCWRDSTRSFSCPWASSCSTPRTIRRREFAHNRIKLRRRRRPWQRWRWG